MKTRVAITSSDRKVIDLHFGRCSAFLIADISDGGWKITETRKTQAACRSFSHDEAHVAEIVELLSDCRYLLTYRIGFYPYSLFRSRGIECLETPSEEPATIDGAIASLTSSLAGTEQEQNAGPAAPAARKEPFL